ncbi:MBL fold metallo-hydrolase [uncultured Hymenobacter sp.]|uniref:MBL fold metallo-hydrolase n=1 Tax=uncultured Hymenobacter sp. TaxID=170016 RepID=UPI0035CADEDF
MPLPSSGTAPAVQIQQFYDKGLAHASYAVRSGNRVALIDPGRDPQPYYDFADEHEARIVAVIETHPHADFVSSHLEIAQETDALIYCSKLVGARYPHKTFDDGDRITLNAVELHALNTPGHSPDSISVLLLDELAQTRAVFTGDTLFVGDVGRPDLREDATAGLTREQLAAQLYQSTRQKLMPLPPTTRVYPAHGPGSLCGKTTSSDLDSTIGKELKTNYALQPMSEPEFIRILLQDQPFVPKYFGHDVQLNRQGAPSFEDSLRAVPRLSPGTQPEPGTLLIDTRPAARFRAGHLPGAINLMDGPKFETWLGSIIGPREKFYLLADSQIALDAVLRKTAKIGYEANVKATLLAPTQLPATSPTPPSTEQVRLNPQAYTIVDIRNRTEAREPIFDHALLIPLPELRERAREIPTGKPVLVHCASGYRSAAGASIVQAALPGVEVYDLGEAVTELQGAAAVH